MTRSAPAGWRRGIHPRVALLVGVGVVAPMGILAWAASASVMELERRLGRERQALAAAVAAGLDHHVQEYLARLSAISSAPGFDLTDQDPAPERAALHATRLRSGHLAGVFLTDRDGRVVCDEPEGTSSARALAGSAELEEALRTGRPAVSGLMPGPPPRLLLLVPFRDWRGGSGGVVAGTVDPASPEWSSQLGREQRAAGSADLVDAGGMVLASTDPTRLFRPSPTRPTPAATASLSAAPWRVVVREAEPEAAGAPGLRRRLLLLGPLLLAVAMLFAWGAARSLTRPLAALDEAARRIARGDLAHPIPAQGADEVGSLARSLETMRGALAESRDALCRERADLERRVAERTRELERLYRKTISAQEDERQRIARELHDETCQALVALGLRFEAALALSAPPEVRQRLVEGKALAAATLDEVHRLIVDLRPSILDDLGLVPAIRWLADRQLQPLGITARCELEDLDGRLPPEVETALFRAVQEALANVARHAEAEAVLIQLGRAGDAILIEIEDDGKGFDPATVADPAPSGRGLGLMGIRERLELVGGRAHIDSSPGHGTRVTLEMPLPEGAAVHE